MKPEGTMWVELDALLTMVIDGGEWYYLQLPAVLSLWKEIGADLYFI
jgi:hypothetical protein